MTAPRHGSLTLDTRHIPVQLHKGDLPADLSFGRVLAIDTETLGLSLVRDRLCLVQMWDGEGDIHLVQLDRETYAAPNLVRVLAHEDITKLFHFARFDVAMIARDLGIVCSPVYCTKIASKLVRTYTDKHGLKDVVKELTGKDISKDQQSSDWGAGDLSDAQIAYAASDVLHLHAVKQKLDVMLARENRTELAQSCFAFLPTRAALDLAGWEDQDIFSHS